jgi:hypothetical protein
VVAELYWEAYKAYHEGQRALRVTKQRAARVESAQAARAEGMVGGSTPAQQQPPAAATRAALRHSNLHPWLTKQVILDALARLHACAVLCVLQECRMAGRGNAVQVQVPVLTVSAPPLFCFAADCPGL